MSNIYEGGFYESATSSSPQPMEESFEERIEPSKVQSLQGEVRNLEDEVAQFFNRIHVNNIVVSQCFVPVEELKKREELTLKINYQNFWRITKTQDIMSVDLKISQLKAELEASSKIQELLKTVQEESEIVKSQQKLRLMFDKYAKEESDLQIEVKLMALDKELQMKKRSDAQLTEFLNQKIREQTQKIEKSRKKTKELSDRLYNESLMNNQQQEESKRSKDKKLIEDSVRLLQANIEKVKRNLQMP